MKCPTSDEFVVMCCGSGSAVAHHLFGDVSHEELLGPAGQRPHQGVQGEVVVVLVGLLRFLQHPLTHDLFETALDSPS